MTPATLRALAAGPGGRLLQSGTAAFLEALAKEGGPSEFDEWRRLPFTRRLDAALLDLALNQNLAGLESRELLVQYGVSQGLALARQLMQDPSSVFRGVFDGNVPGGSVPGPLHETFDASPDAAIDAM